jgi:UDPglucose--hexose-1-phosphate uridylyltransferase
VVADVSELVRHDLRHPDGRAFHVYGELAGGFPDQPAPVRADGSQLQRRFDRMTGAWVLISPARNRRPGGDVAAAPQAAGAVAPGAPACPLCPGGVELPWPYDVAVFDNRFPSLSPDAPPEVHGLVAGSTGRCQVLVYTDDHALRSITELPLPQLVDLLAVLRERTAALWAEGHLYVMAFENHGVEVGATLSHLHGQIYAFGHLPPTVGTKLVQHERHRREEGTCLGCTLVGEDRASERVVAPNDSFTVAVPFGPRWPLEVHLRAVEHGVRRLADLSDDQLLDLARALRDVVGRFDALYDIDLPYMLCVQEAPAPAAGSVEDWHLHVELLPPHRSANRLKVRASVETALGVFINDTWPEEVAARLRDEVVADADWSGVEVPVIRAVP